MEQVTTTTFNTWLKEEIGIFNVVTLEQEAGDYDFSYYEIDMFDEIVGVPGALEVIEQLQEVNMFNITAFCYNGYGNIEFLTDFEVEREILEYNTMYELYIESSDAFFDLCFKVFGVQYSTSDILEYQE